MARLSQVAPGEEVYGVPDDDPNLVAARSWYDRALLRWFLLPDVRWYVQVGPHRVVQVRWSLPRLLGFMVLAVGLCFLFSFGMAFQSRAAFLGVVQTGLRIGVGWAAVYFVFGLVVNQYNRWIVPKLIGDDPNRPTAWTRLFLAPKAGGAAAAARAPAAAEEGGVRDVLGPAREEEDESPPATLKEAAVVAVAEVVVSGAIDALASAVTGSRPDEAEEPDSEER